MVLLLLHNCGMHGTTVCAVIRAQVSVESVGSRERLPTTLTYVRGSGAGRMQSEMAFAIVLARKALSTTWPFTQVWPLLRMRPQMASQIESPCESAPTSRNGTLIHCFIPAAGGRSSLCCCCSNGLFLDLKDRRKSRNAIPIRCGCWRRRGWLILLASRL